MTVGEWRVTLARAFSAMDPWPEVDWLRRLRKLVKGRTAILITHRFTTAMLADEIHVMEDGRIVESGPHLELIAREGPYSQWWEMQQKFERRRGISTTCAPQRFTVSGLHWEPRPRIEKAEPFA